MEKTSVLVLIAEDEAEIRNILQITFEEGGFDVVLVSTGEQAIEALDAQGEALRAVVTDIKLGGNVSGWGRGEARAGTQGGHARRLHDRKRGARTGRRWACRTAS
jgi:CheY-like chemotaxis protein